MSTDEDTAFNDLSVICNRCNTFTRIITTEACDGRLHATIHTELTNFDGISKRFYKIGWNVIQNDNLGRYMYLLTMTAVQS